MYFLLLLWEAYKNLVNSVRQEENAQYRGIGIFKLKIFSAEICSITLIYWFIFPITCFVFLFVVIFSFWQVSRPSIFVC